MYSAWARTWNYSTRYFPRESRRDLKDIEYPAFCQERKKKKKETEMRKMADEMQIYSLHGKVNGAKVCRRSVSVSDRWSHTYIYTHKDGIQGGGELPGRDLRLGHHLPEWPWLVEPPSPPAKYPTNIRILDRCDARACYPKYLRFDDRSRVAPQAPRLRLTRTWRVPRVQKHI